MKQIIADMFASAEFNYTAINILQKYAKQSIDQSVTLSSLDRLGSDLAGGERQSRCGGRGL